MAVIKYESNDSLAHHGVKGMRWGVKRARKHVKEERKAARLNRKEMKAAKKAIDAVGTRREDRAMQKYQQRKAKADSWEQKIRRDRSERLEIAKQSTNSWFQKNGKRLMTAVAISGGIIIASRLLKKRRLSTAKTASSIAGALGR